MEGEADREDLRFRLDWPEDELPKAGDELADFSFEWDEQHGEETLVATGEPQFGEPIDPISSGHDTAFIDTTGALDSVRRALDDNNAALRGLSDAVYELAANVRSLVDEVDATNRSSVTGGGGGITASAMVTMSAEVSGAIEQLSTEVKGTRSDLQGLLDDVVAAVGGQGIGGRSETRLALELERLHSELQALKRRLPVGKKAGPDTLELVDQIVDALLIALPEVGAAPPAPTPRKAIRAEREREEEPAARSARKRQRPLRPE